MAGEAAAPMERAIPVTAEADMKPVSDEALNDEAAGDSVQAEERRQFQHNTTRAMQLRERFAFSDCRNGQPQLREITE